MHRGPPRIRLVPVPEHRDNPNRLTFELVGCDPSMANALRRTLLADVSSLALEWIEIRRNETVIYDEMLSHRLGLVPLRSDSDDVRRLRFPDECSCPVKDPETGRKDCPLCSVEFSLTVHNPGREVRPVTNEDLVWVPPPAASFGDEVVDAAADVHRFTVHSSDPGGTPMTVVELGKDQCLEVRARAQRGRGRTHAKWSPVCHATCQPVADIRLDHDALRRLSVDARRRIVEACPRRTLRLTDDLSDVVVTDPLRSTLGYECVRQAHAEGAPDSIEVRSHRDWFLFELETTGVMSARHALVEATDLLVAKCRRALDDVRRAPVVPLRDRNGRRPATTTTTTTDLMMLPARHVAKKRKLDGADDSAESAMTREDVMDCFGQE